MSKRVNKNSMGTVCPFQPLGLVAFLLFGLCVKCAAAVGCDGDSVPIFVTANLTTIAESGSEPAQIVFRLATPIGDTAHLTLEVTGTAVNGVDFQMIPTQLSLSAGQSQVSLSIVPKPDALIEGTETITVTLTSAVDACAYVGSPNSVTVSMTDGGAPAVPLAAGLDAASLVWTSGGSAPWVGQSSITHDGVDATRCGAIVDFQESWVQTTVAGPGTLAFWWKVSSEMDYDSLEFLIDSVVQRRASGEEGWQQLSFAIAAGNHALRWRYAKDDSTGNGQDRAWLDEVVFMPAAGPPAIVAQPVSQTAGLGDTVVFIAGVGGAAPRDYQWYDQANHPIAGGTNISLTLSNLQMTAAGNYYVVVGNPFGSVTSSNAVLSVTTNGPVQTILLFSDQPAGGPYRTALNNLVQPHLWYSEPTAFNLVVETADPGTTLVIVDAPLTNASFNAVGRFANKGGRAILQSWTLNTGSMMGAPFNANVVQPVLASPLPVNNWAAPGFFSGLTTPLAFMDRFGFSGQRLQPTAEGRAVAGYTSAVTANQAAVVVGHSGRTIFNGFVVEEISVTANAVRFVQNEILSLLGTPVSLGITQAPLNASVVLGGTATFSVAISGNPPPFFYEWRKTGPAPLFTNTFVLNDRVNFFTVTNVQDNLAGSYAVVIRNAASPSGVSTTFTLGLSVDSDSDGLPDDWETIYPTATEAAADTDLDGMTNGQEYLAGTDPTKDGSYLRVDRISRAGSTLIEFSAVSNMTYSVQYCDALGATPWSKLADVVAHTANRVETVTDPNPSTRRYYRLVTPRQE